MAKVYYLYIAYAPCGMNVKGFTPTVFRLCFSDKEHMLLWMKDPKNARFVIELHARKVGVNISGEILQKVIYLDSEMCRELGFPDDGKTLADVVCEMFKRWLDHMKGFGKFPSA